MPRTAPPLGAVGWTSRGAESVLVSHPPSFGTTARASVPQCGSIARSAARLCGCPVASTASKWTCTSCTPSTRAADVQRRSLRAGKALATKQGQPHNHGQRPLLKMEVVPADPVTWWLDEVKALRNEYQKRASTSGRLPRPKNSSEVFLKKFYRIPRLPKTLSSTRSSRGSRTSGRILPMDHWCRWQVQGETE